MGILQVIGRILRKYKGDSHEQAPDEDARERFSASLMRQRIRHIIREKDGVNALAVACIDYITNESTNSPLYPLSRGIVVRVLVALLKKRSTLNQNLDRSKRYGTIKDETLGAGVVALRTMWLQKITKNPSKVIEGFLRLRQVDERK